MPILNLILNFEFFTGQQQFMRDVESVDPSYPPRGGGTHGDPRALYSKREGGTAGHQHESVYSEKSLQWTNVHLYVHGKSVVMKIVLCVPMAHSRWSHRLQESSHFSPKLAGVADSFDASKTASPFKSCIRTLSVL